MKHRKFPSPQQIGEAVFRGEKSLYNFEVYPLNIAFNEVPAIYVITKRKIDRHGKAHHFRICIGQTESLVNEVKNHLRSKSFKIFDANAVAVILEDDKTRRDAVEADLRAAFATQCLHKNGDYTADEKFIAKIVAASVKPKRAEKTAPAAKVKTEKKAFVEKTEDPEPRKKRSISQEKSNVEKSIAAKSAAPKKKVSANPQTATKLKETTGKVPAEKIKTAKPPIKSKNSEIKENLPKSVKSAKVIVKTPKAKNVASKSSIKQAQAEKLKKTKVVAPKVAIKATKIKNAPKVETAKQIKAKSESAPKTLSAKVVKPVKTKISAKSEPIKTAKTVKKSVSAKNASKPVSTKSKPTVDVKPQATTAPNKAKANAKTKTDIKTPSKSEKARTNAATRKRLAF